MAWLPDGSGFAYTRYPDPEEVGDEEAGYHRTVWWHRLGDVAADDTPCFTDLPNKEAWPEVSLSNDGRWLLVHVELGWSQTDVHLLDRDTDQWTTIIEGVEATTWFRVDAIATGWSGRPPSTRRRAGWSPHCSAIRRRSGGSTWSRRATTSSRPSRSPATTSWCCATARVCPRSTSTSRPAPPSPTSRP